MIAAFNNRLSKFLNILEYGACLVVQWLRICLSMQGTCVPSLVWEYPTCHGATKPACHNYRARVLQLLKPPRPKACAPQQEKSPQ